MEQGNVLFSPSKTFLNANMKTVHDSSRERRKN